MIRVYGVGEHVGRLASGSSERRRFALASFLILPISCFPRTSPSFFMGEGASKRRLLHPRRFQVVLIFTRTPGESFASFWPITLFNVWEGTKRAVLGLDWRHPSLLLRFVI